MMSSIFAYLKELYKHTSNVVLSKQIKYWDSIRTDSKQLTITSYGLATPIQLNDFQKQQFCISIAYDNIIEKLEILPKRGDPFNFNDPGIFALFTHALSCNKTLKTIRLHTLPPIKNHSIHTKLLCDALKENYTITSFEISSKLALQKNLKKMDFYPYIFRNQVLDVCESMLISTDAKNIKFSIVGYKKLSENITQILTYGCDIVNPQKRDRLMRFKSAIDMLLSIDSDGKIDPKIATLADTLPVDIKEFFLSEKNKAKDNHLLRSAYNKTQQLNARLTKIDELENKLIKESNNCWLTSSRALKKIKRESLFKLKQDLLNKENKHKTLIEMENKNEFGKITSGFFSQRTKKLIATLKSEFPAQTQVDQTPISTQQNFL